MVCLRNLVILATSLASIQLVSAGPTKPIQKANPPSPPTPAKTNSNYCREVVDPKQRNRIDWMYVTTLEVNDDPNVPIKSASGSSTIKDVNTTCQFDVNFGFNPFGEYDQIDQRISCNEKNPSVKLDFQFAYQGPVTTYKVFGLTSKGGIGRCDTFAGDFKFDVKRVDRIDVYQRFI